MHVLKWSLRQLLALTLYWLLMAYLDPMKFGTWLGNTRAASSFEALTLTNYLYQVMEQMSFKILKFLTNTLNTSHKQTGSFKLETISCENVMGLLTN